MTEQQADALARWIIWAQVSGGCTVGLYTSRARRPGIFLYAQRGVQHLQMAINQANYYVPSRVSDCGVTLKSMLLIETGLNVYVHVSESRFMAVESDVEWIAPF